MTERMNAVLVVLFNNQRAMTPNEIGHALGFHHGHKPGAPSCNHAGRTMGAAQRVIGALNALRARKLVDFERRPDGLSGTAYRITKKGIEWVK